MPEGDEEDEAVERRGRVGPREVEHVVEDHGRDPDGRGEGQQVGRHEDQRGRDRAQQEQQDHEDDAEDRRDDDLEVSLAGLPDVQVDGGAAADEDLGADLVETGADRLDGRLGLDAVGRRHERRLDEHLAVDDLGRLARDQPDLRALDAVDGAEHLDHLVGLALGRDDLDRRARARGEVPREDLLAGHRVDGREEQVRLRDALGLERREERRAGGQQDERDDPGPPSVGADHPRDAAPDPAAADGVLRVGVVDLGDCRARRSAVR